MKRYQIQIKSFTDPAAEWKSVADTNSPDDAERKVHSLRPSGHLARIYDWDAFDSIYDIDSVGAIRRAVKV